MNIFEKYMNKKIHLNVRSKLQKYLLLKSNGYFDLCRNAF